MTTIKLFHTDTVTGRSLAAFVERHCETPALEFDAGKIEGWLALEAMTPERDSRPALYLPAIVLDTDPSKTTAMLEGMNSIERARTAVVTLAHSAILSDVLASYHISGIYNVPPEGAGVDSLRLTNVLIGAAIGQRSHQWSSGLTYMELRVLRLLLAGKSRTDIARRLSISTKTVTSHCSNIVAKTAADSITDLVDKLLREYDRCASEPTPA